MKPDKCLAQFDTSAAMYKALARYLNGRRFSRRRLNPLTSKPALSSAARSLNRLPSYLRKGLLRFSARREAVSTNRIHKVNSDKIAEWMVGLYPRRRYPAVMIGSANGAAAHLCAALGIPWLPQTLLIPVQRDLPAHDPKDDLDWGRQHAARLLENNPDIQLHHMVDPVQDFLSGSAFAYFRIKRLKLGNAYARFIKENLEPGGMIIISDCRLKWPVKRLAERHYFQFGALGGASLRDYFQGSSETRSYLEQLGRGRARWDCPVPNAHVTEAEWGFAEALSKELEDFAKENGCRIVRLGYENPVDLSPFTADLYRWWYEERGLLSNRLLAESFMLIEPFWALRTGSVPFWLPFPGRPFDSDLEAYLHGKKFFDQAGIILFSQGSEPSNLVETERWKEILSRSAEKVSLLGIDGKKGPRDLGVFYKYQQDIKKNFKARYPLPGYLTLRQLERFIQRHGAKYKVEWTGIRTSSPAHPSGPAEKKKAA